ncbi:MAG TPA: questin oxidase family protein [Oligoflexia bacterium]|nr:questin oxidase family protein [Oligoflexia bacterium]HMR25081.1 questin oxidase family protein [Oligoflexia bacterium]
MIQNMLAQSLIQKHNTDFSSYYKTELYTHTPMALLALKEMGASDLRLEDFYKISVKKLKTKSAPSVVITANNWKEYLGQHAHEAAYIQFFKKEMKHLGQDKVIASYFDQLMPGVAAAAFHPLIRLFYAVRFNIPEEIVISLATWATSYLDLGLDAHLSHQLSLGHTLKQFEEQKFNQGQKIIGSNIAKRMLAVSKMTMFKELSNLVDQNDLQPLKLEQALLWLFSQNNNFTLLHAITSQHAFESLYHFSSKSNESRVIMWKALLAAYLSTTGSVNIDFNWQYPEIKLPDWEVLTAKAIQSNDEHVIKLLHVLSIKKTEGLENNLRYAGALKLGLN